MKLNIRSKLMGGFGVGLLIMLIIGVVTYVSTVSLVNNSASVDHTHEVLEALDQIMSSLKDSETGQRGFLITAEDRYLEPYNASLSEIPCHIAHVADLTSDNPDQQARIRALEPLVAAKLAELKETIDLRRNEGFDAAQAVVLTDAGKQVMDDLRGVITAMADEELALLDVRAALTASTATTVKTSIIVGTTIAFVLLGGIAFYLSRSISNGVNSVGQALQRIAQGDVTAEVDTSSSDEIGDMARSYMDMRGYIQEVSANVGLIGDGDLTIKVEPRFENDVLGQAMVRMLASMTTLIGQVGNTANSLAVASNELSTAADQAGGATSGIASSSQQMASGAEEQSKGVDQTNSVMAQLTTAIDQIADSSQEQASGVDEAATIVNQVSTAIDEVAKTAQEAAEGSRTAGEAARSGADLVNQTVEGMGKISVAVDAAATQIAELGTQSEEIGKDCCSH
jgi:methyl-accepting chemotaxis protein